MRLASWMLRERWPFVFMPSPPSTQPDMEWRSPEIVREAADVLRRKYGPPIRLEVLDAFETSPNKQASTVLRCRVLDGAAELPSTLVVKKVRFDGGAKDGPYRPDGPKGPNIAFGFFNEWAALQLL